jgi:NADH dehydrogenase
MKTEDYPDGLPALAQPAIQQGKQLAVYLGRIIRNQKLKNFRYRNKGVLATIGRNKAVADFSSGMKLSGFTGWIIWMFVHLAFLIGFRNKIIVFANWIWNYFTFDRGIRLILRPSSKKQDNISKDMESEMKESISR